MDDLDEKVPMGKNMEETRTSDEIERVRYSPRSSSTIKWKKIAIASLIFCILFLVGMITLIVIFTTDRSEFCSVDDVDQDEHRSYQIYRGLSAKETNEVIQYMMKDEELNLFSVSEANLSRNYIYTVEDHLPDKQDVINYLSGETDKPPQREARVLLFLGETKHVKEYLVWPIPKPTQKKEAFVNRRVGQDISWTSRPIDNVVEMPLLTRFIIDEMKPLNDWLKECLADLSNKCIGVECIYPDIIPRMVLSSSDRYYLTTYRFIPELTEDYYLYPVGLYAVFSMYTIQNQLKLQAVYFNDVKYTSVADLLTAIENNPSLKLVIGNPDKLGKEYGSPKYEQGTEGQTTDNREPQQFYPDRQRFTVNKRHVKYLGWSFDFHFRTLSGLQLFNLRFNDDMIAYELSIQDILVLYSGGPPDDFFKNYFDNGWASGKFTTPLMKGIDCPSNAVYLDVELYGISQDRAVTINDGVCVFEHRNSVPLRRHYSADFYDGSYRFIFSMADSVLIVRQILTVWNYDYLIDYEFHQNGAVEAKVSSTGYVAVTKGFQSSRYGQVINSEWGVVANVHHHLFNFKIDLDVVEQKNSFKLVKFATESIPDTAWTGGTSWEQMKLEDVEVTSESNSRLKYNFDEPKYYVFYNPNEKQDDMNRGYRIQSTGFSKVVIPDSHPLMNGAAWAKYQLAVSKYSDNERTTASHFVQGNPYDPAVSFESFFENDDSLVDADLVAWVTVGLHHIPTNEDLPVTTTPGKTLSVSLLPYNFYKRDPSIHSKDAAVFWNKKLYNFENAVRIAKQTCVPKVERSKPS